MFPDKGANEDDEEVKMEEIKGHPRKRGGKRNKDNVANNRIENYIFSYGSRIGTGLNSKKYFVEDTIKFLIESFDPMHGQLTLPDAYSQLVNSMPIFETNTSALSRKLVLERQDTTFGHVFMYYLRDREFDNEMHKLRQDFKEKMQNLLGILPENIIDIDCTELGDQRRHTKFSEETRQGLRKFVDRIYTDRKHGLAK